MLDCADSARLGILDQSFEWAFSASTGQVTSENKRLTRVMISMKRQKAKKMPKIMLADVLPVLCDKGSVLDAMEDKAGRVREQACIGFSTRL